MRIIFMGSPDFAVPTLEALVAGGHELACVYTQPPRPAGRGKALQPTAVERRARDLGLEVRSPARLRDPAEQAAFAALDADIAVVAAYGLLLPQPVLDAPRLGCLNVHASLLPRWRGAAPVQRAILAGDTVTGVTLMQMEAGLDTGPMRMTREIAIGTDNALDLTRRLATLGAEMVGAYLADPEAFPARPQPDEGVTHAAKIRKDEARLDWAHEADALARQVQALAPFPGAWFELGGERIKVLAAEAIDASGAPGTLLGDPPAIACARGALRPLLVQRAGRGAMAMDELLRGFAWPVGTRLS